MEQYNQPNSLLREFPLDEGIENTLVGNFSSMKNFLLNVVIRSYKFSLPEQTCSEITQLFFFKCLEKEALFLSIPRFKIGLDIINEHLADKEKIFKNYLLSIAKNSMQRGVPDADLEYHLMHYFEAAFRQVYPNQPSILDEVYKSMNNL